MFEDIDEEVLKELEELEQRFEKLIPEIEEWEQQYFSSLYAKVARSVNWASPSKDPATFHTLHKSTHLRNRWLKRR